MASDFACFLTYPMEPPGGTIATRRSNALQLFVYISRTSARGTSAFLYVYQPMLVLRLYAPTYLLVSMTMYRFFSLAS